MDLIRTCFLLANVILHCSTISLNEQLKHVIRRRAESLGLLLNDEQPNNNRRSFHLDAEASGRIVGAPDLPSHLPPSEPILPGHTLLRPAFGMLKSAVKFPHRNLIDGAGVYGNFKHGLSMKYDGLDERVLYTYFRRSTQPRIKKNHHRIFSPYHNGNMSNRNLKQFLVMVRRKEEMKNHQQNTMFINTRRSPERPKGFNREESIPAYQSPITDQENNEGSPRVARKADAATCDEDERQSHNWFNILRDRYSVKKLDMNKLTFLQLFPSVHYKRGIGRQGSEEAPSPVVNRHTGDFYTKLKLYSHAKQPDYDRVFSGNN